jgi:hypothetical protein
MRGWWLVSYKRINGHGACYSVLDLIDNRVSVHLACAVKGFRPAPRSVETPVHILHYRVWFTCMWNELIKSAGMFKRICRDGIHATLAE